MKSFYELTNEELKKYQKEFYELYYSKKTLNKLLIFIFLWLGLIVVVALINGFAAINGAELMFPNMFLLVLGIMYIVVLFVFWTLYYHDFRRWLKLKYNLE